MKLRQVSIQIYTVTMCGIILSITFFGPLDAAEFPRFAMKSTVSVLPYGDAKESWDNNPEEPEGSGIAVFDGSYIATAAHVINGATGVYVRLYDGRIVPAQIIGRDNLTDLALMKIDIELLPFNISEKLKLAQDVCAIGNQFGLGLSVTCGVLSAMHRSNVGFNPIEDFLQTDAVVNPGASGGALIDTTGRLLGMISGIFTKGSDADVGVNFAVNGNLLMRVLEDLRDFGRVRQVKSGMVVEALNLYESGSQNGVRVIQVEAGTPAAKAGLQIGDVIVGMVDREIRYISDVNAVIYGRRSDDDVAVIWLRDGVKFQAAMMFGG